MYCYITRISKLCIVTVCKCSLLLIVHSCAFSTVSVLPRPSVELAEAQVHPSSCSRVLSKPDQYSVKQYFQLLYDVTFILHYLVTDSHVSFACIVCVFKIYLFSPVHKAKAIEAFYSICCHSSIGCNVILRPVRHEQK